MIRVHLLNDCVIDVKVSEMINGNKISNSQTECRPLCGVAEKLKVPKAILQLPHESKINNMQTVFLTLCCDELVLELSECNRWSMVVTNCIL